MRYLEVSLFYKVEFKPILNTKTSLGLIIYESMSGKFAFQRENITEEDLIEIIIKAQFDYENENLKPYPESAKEMLKRMLKVSLFIQITTLAILSRLTPIQKLATFVKSIKIKFDYTDQL